MNIPFEVDPPKNKTGATEKNQASPSTKFQTTAIPISEQIQKPISVSQLTKQITLLLESEFRTVTVDGELTNVKKASSGHIYFALKDEFSQIRCVMFRQFASMTSFQPESGLKVLVRGNLSVYKQKGEYQIIISSMEPRGLGALQLAFDQLKNKLDSEGLFNQEVKKKLPFLPRRIGIVTSPTGAVIHDMITVLERRFPEIPILLFPVQVQGDLAVNSLVEGVHYLNTLRNSHQIDVLIIGRGGGSMEDLCAFNSEELARAIFSSKIPIISAVGHETDFTIADFVSDIRAPTPSSAIELAVPNKKDLRYTLDQKQEQLKRSLLQNILRYSENIKLVRQRLISPILVLRQNAQQVDDLDSLLRERIYRQLQDLSKNTERFFEKIFLLNPKRDLSSFQNNLILLKKRLNNSILFLQKERNNNLQHQKFLLDNLSPISVLKRGYSVTMDINGKSLNSVKDVKSGSELRVLIKDGSLQTKVISINSKEKNKPS